MNKYDILTMIGKENPTILEIGSNDGDDTVGFLQTFYKLNLYCFEPDIRAIQKFKSHINDPRCKLIEIAIGNVDGEIEFYQSGGNPGGEYVKFGDWDKSSSIKKPKNHLLQHQWCNFDKTTKVQCKKLDTWVSENSIEFIDFIWADVQGAEEDLILGGINTLKNKTAYLYTEYNNNEMYEKQINLDKIVSLLEVFSVVKVFENDVLLKNRNF